MTDRVQASLWESCPVCRSAERVPFVERTDFTFVGCQCGLVYKSRDQVSEAEQPQTAWNERYTRRRRHRVTKARRQILDLLNHVEVGVAAGPLLDVGCSLGYTLEAAAGLGLEARGFDVNEAVVDICRERGLDTTVGDVNGPYPYEDGAFRLAVLKHVLEHTPTPRAALAELRRVLAPGGGAFVALPNLDYYKARKSPETYHFFKPGRGGTQHYVYYTPELFSRLLAEEGFRTVRVHPHLWQKRASFRERLLSLVALPLRAVWSPLRTRLGLRREFWLVAVREP